MSKLPKKKNSVTPKANKPKEKPVEFPPAPTKLSQYAARPDQIRYSREEKHDHPFRETR